MKRTLIIVGVAFVAALTLGLWINSYIHEQSIKDQNHLIHVTLIHEGVTQTGTPNVAAGYVPFKVTPTCTVDMFVRVSNQGETVTLDLNTPDATGRLIGPIDPVSNATDAAKTQKNLAAILALSPHNQVCQRKETS